MENKTPDVSAGNPPKQLSVLLDQIEQRANAATPGPWRVKRHWKQYNWQGAILLRVTWNARARGRSYEADAPSVQEGTE